MHVIDTGRTVLSLAFSPDGGRLAMAGWKHVAVLELASGHTTELQQDACTYCQGVVWSADGERLAWAAMTDTRQGNGLRVGPLAGGVDAVHGVHGLRLDFAAPPDHGFLADGSLVGLRAGKVLGWGPDVTRPPSSAAHRLKGKAIRLAVSPGGTDYAVGTERDGLCLVSGATSDPKPIGTAALTGLGYTADRLVWFTSAHGLTVYDPDRDEYLSRDVPVPTPVAAVTPDGRRALVRAGHTVVSIVETATGAEVGRLDWRVGSLDTIAVAPDGLTAAAAGPGGEVVLFDLD